MARMISVVVQIRKGSTYGEWLEIREAMNRQEIAEREVEKALSALIVLAAVRPGCPERGSQTDAPAKELWQDVFFFVRHGALSPREVSENLRQLRKLGVFLPIPARVRDSWPRLHAVAGNHGGVDGSRRLL
ncbi:MAG: hypothetical protein NTW66_03045 [Candidatus Magasanikbacteria bacterium]|nr:hypothetical protein [Candidatus Magasanikbacteria bacterium]